MTLAGPLPQIVAQWGAPAIVRALSTVREGGLSGGPYGQVGGAPGGLNLGDHVGDDPVAVAGNRARLASAVPAEVRWLVQEHGTSVHDADEADAAGAGVPRADAAVTTRPGVALAVLTADCLPVLLADTAGRAVGIAHAGWRGLAAGVLEATVRALRQRAPDAAIVAWLGPAIGPDAFEVGDDVRDAFVGPDPVCAGAFVAGRIAGKWQADLFALATRRLAAAGVTDVAGGGVCTVADPRRFYSYRRDGRTGRMASLVWIARR
jgi:YfiH family protein